MLKSDIEDVKKVMNDVLDSMIRVDAEKEFMKETIDALAEKHMIDKKILKKVSTIMYKANMAEVQAANNDVEELYENLNA
jgi:hypothetical protein